MKRFGSVEEIVKYNMELWTDKPSSNIKSKWHTGGMMRQKPMKMPTQDHGFVEEFCDFGAR